jgi:hypothetical protein
MQEEIYFQAIQSLLLIGAALFVSLVLLRNMAIDNFRQALFALRDRFFDEAMKGKIEFSHPAYKYLRDEMNKNIRFSHKHSVWTIISFLPVYRRHSLIINEEVAEAWESVTKDLTDEQLKLVQSYSDKESAIFLKHILFFSPEIIPILLLMLIPVIGLILFYSVSRLRRALINSNKVVIGEFA